MKRKRCVENYWAIVIWPDDPYFVVDVDTTPLIFVSRGDAHSYMKSQAYAQGAKPRIVRVEVREMPR